MSGINLGKKRRAGAAIYLYVLYLVGRTDGLLSLGSRRSSTSTAPHERTAAAAVCSRRRVQGAAVFGTNLKTDRRGNGSSRGAPIRIRGNTHTHAGCRYDSGLRKRVFLSLSTALGERAWGSKLVPRYLPTTHRRRTSVRHGYMLHANPACVRVGTWVHLTDLPNRRPGFSPPPSISTGSCRQPQQPAPLIPISFSNGNEDSSFFFQQVFFSRPFPLGSHQLWGLSPCQTVVGCQRPRGYPSPDWNASGPHPETVERCPSRTEAGHSAEANWTFL